MPANDTMKSSWTSVAPNPLSTIQWFVGDSNLAAKTAGVRGWRSYSEPGIGSTASLFAGGAPGALGPVSATFGGPLPVNSTATNSGQGQSQIVNLNGIGPAVNASWRATATGMLGTKAGASWQAVTTAKDPWRLRRARFRICRALPTICSSWLG